MLIQRGKCSAPRKFQIRNLSRLLKLPFTTCCRLSLQAKMSRPPPLPKSPVRSRIWLACLAALLLLQFLTVLGMHLHFRLTNAKAVRRLEARARARGEPLTLAELAAKQPSIPDDQNAAVELLKLWEKDDPAFWQAFRLGHTPLPTRRSAERDPELPFLGSPTALVTRSGPLSAESLAAAEVCAKEHEEHFEVVRSALRRPRRVCPLKITDGFAALMPYLPTMKGEAQSFRVLVALNLERGDVDGALSAIEDVRRTGQSLTDGPFLIDQLVRVACLTMVFMDAERLLSQQHLSVAQLDRLEAIMQQTEANTGLCSSLVSERASMLDVFTHSSEVLAQVDSQDVTAENARNLQLGMKFFTAVGIAATDRRLMLETMEQALTFAQQDSPSALQRYQELFAQVGKDARRFPPKLFSAMLLPPLAKAAERFASLEARRRAALAAVAVERYRALHNRHPPDNLDNLVPDLLPRLPLDPFDGRPLRYRRLQSGFVLYSVGADLQDDGGKERPKKGPAKDYDETFIVER